MKIIVVADLPFSPTESVKTFTYHLPAGKVCLFAYTESQQGSVRQTAKISCSYLNRNATAYQRHMQRAYRPDAPTLFEYVQLRKMRFNQNIKSNAIFELGNIAGENLIKGVVKVPLGFPTETCRVQILAKIYD